MFNDKHVLVHANYGARFVLEVEIVTSFAGVLFSICKQYLFVPVKV